MELLTTQPPVKLAGGGEIRLTTPEVVSLTGRTRLSWDAHWLHESTGNRMAGIFGSRIETDVTAAVRVSLRLIGDIRINPDDNGWLRVRWIGDTSAAAAIPPFINVSVENLEIPADAAPRLGTSLLGLPPEDDVVAVALSSFAGWRSLSSEVMRDLSRIIGRVRTEDDWRRVTNLIEETRGFCGHLLNIVAPAIERSVSLSLVRALERRRGMEILDCSFAFSAEGQQMYERLCAGDLNCISDAPAGSIHVHSNALAAPEATVIELHLPCVEKKLALQRGAELSADRIHIDESARVIVAPGGGEQLSDYQGRLHATTVVSAPATWSGKQSSHRFRIGFDDVRTVSRARLRPMLQPFLDSYGFDLSTSDAFRCLPPDNGPVQVSISLRMPGHAGEAWLRMPKERTVGHYNAMLQASVGLQAALRFWLPYIHFTDPDRYMDLDTAWSMLVYQSVRPYRRKGAAEFTYDPVNPRRLQTAFRNSAKSLPLVLRPVHESVAASGRSDLADYYAPRRSEKILERVQRIRRPFQNLLAVDGGCVGQLVKIGNHARRVRRSMASTPETASRGVFIFGNEIAKQFRVQLRHLGGKGGYTPLVSLVLLEATAGMAAHFEIEAPVEATLRVNPLSDPAGEIVATARTTGPRAHIWL